MSSNFYEQLNRLEVAGICPQVLCEMSETLTKKKNDKPWWAVICAPMKKGTPVILPYIHRLSHNLKKLANRFHIPLVFSAPNERSNSCVRGSTEARKSRQQQREYAQSTTQLSFADVQDSATTRQSPFGNLSANCDHCERNPDFEETKVVSKFRIKVAREIHKAFLIKLHGKDIFVNAP